MHEPVYTSRGFRPRYMDYHGPVRKPVRRERQDRAAHVRGWRGHLQEGAERVAGLVRRAEDAILADEADPDRIERENTWLWGFAVGIGIGAVCCIVMASWMWDVYAHFVGLGWL